MLKQVSSKFQRVESTELGKYCILCFGSVLAVYSLGGFTTVENIQGAQFASDRLR